MKAQTNLKLILVAIIVALSIIFAPTVNEMVSENKDERYTNNLELLLYIENGDHESEEPQSNT